MTSSKQLRVYAVTFTLRGTVPVTLVIDAFNADRAQALGERTLIEAGCKKPRFQYAREIKETLP